MTGVSRLFVDTNILLYYTDLVSVWYVAAARAIETARRQNVQLVVSPQILREYLVVFSRGIGGVVPPMQPILQNIETIRRMVELVEENDSVIAHLMSLVQTIPIGGKQIHDANIVATMRTHGIDRLLTHNVAHFTRFSHLITIVPLRSFV